MTREKDSNILTIIFTIIMLLTVVGFLIRKDYKYVFNSIPIYFSYLLFICFENKKGFRIEKYIKTLVITTAIFHNSFGQYLNLYRTTIWFDKSLHVFGTFSFALFCYSVLNLSIGFFSKSKIFTFILAMSLGTVVGAVLENFEFLMDIIFKTNNQHGNIDTNLDLIFNSVGAILAGFFIIFNKIDFNNRK